MQHSYSLTTSSFQTIQQLPNQDLPSLAREDFYLRTALLSGLKEWRPIPIEGIDGKSTLKAKPIWVLDTSDKRDRLKKAIDSWKQHGKSVNFHRLLLWCIDLQVLFDGRLVHSYIIRNGLVEDVLLVGRLFELYLRCGTLVDALDAFEYLHERNTLQWNRLLAGHVNCGHWKNALSLFCQMRLEDVQPDRFTFITILNGCSRQSAQVQGKLVHAQICPTGLDSDVVVGTALVKMYTKCTDLESARNTFDKIMEKDAMAWNIMLASYVQHRHTDQALQFFAKMREEWLKPDKVTFSSILNVCSLGQQFGQIKLIHACIVHNSYETDVIVATALVNIYGKGGDIENAYGVFSKIDNPDILSWTSMIIACTEHGQSKKALWLYQVMQSEGVTADKFAIAAILNACIVLPTAIRGLFIHASVLCRKLESDTVLGTSLINMYGKSGLLEDASMAFHRIHHQDVVSWTALIGAYAEYGYGKYSLGLLWQMQMENISPDKYTFVTILNACSSPHALSEGCLIHACIIDFGFGSETAVQNALITMYSKCGSFEKAYKVFSEMPERNVISWTAILAACCGNDHAMQALYLFEAMQQEGVEPNDITLLSVADACANLGSLSYSKVVHNFVAKRGFEGEVVMGTALLNMYARCGSLEDVCRVFAKISLPDVGVWNAMLLAYAQHGHVKECLQLFQQMQLTAVQPNEITFVNVISACSHTGLMEIGCQLFLSMRHYGITPCLDHYGCLVDLLGRAKLLKESMDLMHAMPFEADAAMWSSLLSPSRTKGDLAVAISAVDSVIELEPHMASVYVALSNIYAETDGLDPDSFFHI